MKKDDNPPIQFPVSLPMGDALVLVAARVRSQISLPKPDPGVHV